MKNPCINAFIQKDTKVVKYGKWKYSDKKLWFDCFLVASHGQGIMYVFSYTLTEVGWQYQTYHAIAKVVRHLSQINGSYKS